MSIEQMRLFLDKHKDKYVIRDEYCHELTLEQLNEELIDWGKDQVVRNYKWMMFNGHEELRASDNDEYDMQTPFSHIEYSRQYSLRHGIDRTGDWNYYKDNEGYEFTTRSNFY